MQDVLPEIIMYTDGGAEPNPGVGGIGVVLLYNEHRKEHFQGYELTTNNRMELMAIIVGLNLLKRKSKVQVYSDSKYVVDALNLGWVNNWKNNNWYKKKDKAENVDLWIQLLALIDKHQVSFSWVKGHADNVENERCDALATQGIHADKKEVDTEYVNRAERGEDYGKVLKEGDECKKCGTPVVKRIPKNRKIKDKNKYYYEYYLLCPQCSSQYNVESAKREIDKGQGLFD